jgi:signal transduction histidine kinase
MASDPTKTLERLQTAARELGAHTDLESYLQSLLSAAIELTGSESASLLEYDEAAQEFHFKLVPWFHRDATRSARVPLDGSVAGWVFQNMKPLAIDDATIDARHYKTIDQLTGFVTRSILAVPLVARGKPVGVFEAFNKKDTYTISDILVLETLAALATAALQNDALEKNATSSPDEIRELERMKNEFIAITSHELRTPLGLILGHATFLKELLGSQHDEQVDSIIRNAARLKEIIESLTRMDNYETGGALIRSRQTSVARIIEDVIASFSDMAGKKNIALKKDIPAGQDLPVEIDSGKISVALSNLMKNALTFTDEGGEVIVCGGQQPDFVQVSVQDNGLGIPANDLPRIFDRFYQVESHLTRRHGGMGLGLSVAKAMIEMHGGRIWAESENGQGSTFTFILPTRAAGSQPEK